MLLQAGILCLATWFILVSYVASETRCIDEMQTANKCDVRYIPTPEQRAPLFKIGGDRYVKTLGLGLVITSRNPRMECAINVNIETTLRRLMVQQSVSIQQISIFCQNPARVSFCRPANFTANNVILYLRFQSHCRVTVADLAAWGRATDLRVLGLLDNVSLQEDGETKQDLKGLLNIGSLALINLKNKTMPGIFLSHVWEKMAEVILSKISLKSSLDVLRTTMPHLQSLEVSQNDMRELPAFPWCNASLELPRNLSRTTLMNELYSQGASVNPRIYARFLAVDFNPLMNNLSIPQGNLDRISLRGNNLKFINPAMFDEVVNLKVVDLSENNLSEISERIFEKTPHLVEIDFARNNLSSIKGKTFAHLKNLRKLNVGHNFIQILQNGFLTDKLEKLEELNFENNSLRFTEPHAIPRGVFDTLKTINFGCNKLRSIPQFGLYAGYLENFNLSDNAIDFAAFLNAIDSIYLHDFLLVHSDSTTSVYRIAIKSRSKKILNLQRNEIERFDITDFNKTRLLKLEFFLKAFTVLLTGNPIHCDCTTRKLQIKLSNWSKFAKEITKKDFDTWACHSPSDLRGKKILSVSPKALRCETPYPKCPSFCTCYRSYSESSISVDCRRRNLTAAPDELPNGRIVLHLENNEIESLSFSRSMENVTALYFSHNKLRRVNLKHFPSKLKEIYLNSNKLTTLPESFQNLSLSRINLQNNFFTCGCENSWMKKWLKREAKAFIGGAGSVACSSGDNQAKPLVSVEDTDFICAQSRHKVNVGEVTGVNAISAYVVAGFLFIVLVTVAIVYGFRKELKLVLYTRFNWHPFDRVDDSDPSKIYDAFVSFNKGDVGWVMETLRNKLENDNPPYKLCIHCRDFIPGARIAENILESVKTSRRMIMVLSRHFIQSEWCMLEFRAAHRKVLKGRANYLIIVIFDDVDLESLDEELKLYLKTNTYLSVHSKWFWQQLKYALPQKRMETRDGPVDAGVGLGEPGV